jgi:outer membrane receptor protein involved in Fe transport
VRGKVKVQNKTALIGLMVSAIANNSYAEKIELNDMTVTGTRSKVSIYEQAARVGAKSGDEIVLDKALTQKELLNSIAGVRITQTGSTIGHMASIRLPNNTSPYYLYLQDNIPVQSSGFFNHNGLAFTTFNAASGVEVLKGAGTALYGSDAVGATVNVLSASPYDELGSSFALEAGSDQFRRYTVKGATELDENSAISANLSHAESDGWRDHSEFDRQELAVRYINDLNDDNTLKLGLDITKFEAEMTSEIKGFRRYRNEPTYVGDNAERTIAAGVDPVRKFDFARLNAEWNHRLSEHVDLDTIVYVRQNRNRYNATWENNAPSNDSKENSVGLLFKADINLERARVISGVDIEYTQAEREYTQEFDFVPSGFGSPVAAGTIYDYDVDYTAFAPYTRVEYALTNKLTLGAGLRYDINKFEYTNNLEDGQYASSTYARASSDTDPTFNHLSPKLDLSYQLADQEIVYARYANGFRIPQASRLYSLRTNNIEFDIDEEITNTFEIGYKVKTDNHAFEAAIYYLNIDDTIVRRENSDGDRFYVNGDQTEHKGIELSLSSSWTNEWHTKVAYSYSKHEFKDDEVYGDNDQAEAPEHIANVRLIYTPQAIAGFTGMLEWEHVGSYWLDDTNENGRYAGHDVANLKMRYKVSNDLTVFARVINITDRLYAETASYSFGNENYTPASPRQVFVGFEYSL